MGMPFQKLVIASGNQGKLREIQALLAPLSIEVLPQSAFNVPEAEEPFVTFIENALAKARHASRHTGLPALADDSGICVNALQGAPGVYSARYAGEPKSDERNNQKLLQSLDGQHDRHAYYYCIMVLVRHDDDPQPLIAEGIWQGEILAEQRGSGGFGYDPLFLDAKTGQTAAELPAEIKNRISHRGHALTKLVQQLERLAL
ncbi:RdgB/HAM1 family non-canonical purine NTP pyrophosphatase [Methylobacillus flagellatus]|uniref:RdgB/HAM1 family non-canonical purine NTP pyrophosphatase n=1 Tax=Methylobacillus flagellatus TaxID=405 RepID=UPI002853D0D4|nr:RdgB/HAM1 family non-canonical purine NTP pyrophosphatase [Methylobacillus flagellatus]MDR5172171.1 RdgB/HAM1 family non-canonical purine NTP pyrophosphatase [Methylobacillus flagellatus]